MIEETTISPSQARIASGHEAARRQIAIWLFCVAGLIFLMVIVGGLTRLTESGLSITQWKPVSGTLPPLSDAAWQDAFQRYKQIPQYEYVNKGMSLAEFKEIFWWEWGHRQLGRLIGFAFFVPFVFFIVTRRVDRQLAPHLAVMFLLGGAQGALGWWMVKSGLSDRLEVSQYRLVAHLGLATAIYVYMLWTALGLWRRVPLDRLVSRGLVLSALGLVGFVYLQILMGGFVAGLRAGHIYNTWPLMLDAFIPDGLFSIAPWWRSVFEDMLTAQFMHRLVAYTMAGFVIWHLVAAWRSNSTVARQGATWLAIAVGSQVLLGIWTLLWVVPIPLGAAHQAGALIVLTLAIWHAQRLNAPAD